MARPSLEYARRDPGGSVLYRIVRDDFETFRVEAARLLDGDGLPWLVEAEFRAFHRCGWVDSMAAGMSLGETTYDAAKKTFNGTIEGPDGSGGVMKARSTTIITPGTRVFILYGPWS